MRRPGHLALFSVVLVAALAATAPIRMVGTVSFLRDAGISAAGATGTIWHGQLQRVRVGAVELGDVDASLSILALMRGTTALGLAAETGTGTLVSGRRQGFEAVTGRWPLALPTSSGPIEVELQVSDLTVLFRDRRCVEARGTLSAMPKFPANLPTGALPGRFVGELVCRDDHVEARLATEPGQPPLEVVLAVDGSGDYRLQWFTPEPAPEMGIVLGMLGFQPGPGGMSRLDEGRLLP